MARVRALAGHRQRCWRQTSLPAVQEGVGVCTLPQAEKQQGVVCVERSYKHDGWQSYGHWLGTGNLVGGKLAFLPFKKALVYAHSLKLKSQTEWKDWAKTGVRPANMPSRPDETYKHDGWQNYGHWLGTGNVGVRKDQQFLPFKKALLYARTLKMKDVQEWKDWAKTGVRSANMPSTPDKIYKHDGWQGCGHWLGTGNAAPKDKQFLPFKKALMYARALKLKGLKEWKDWAKTSDRPVNMPFNPDRTYKHDGWQGYEHWLGTGNVAPEDTQFLPFKLNPVKIGGCGARPAHALPTSPCTQTQPTAHSMLVVCQSALIALV